MPRSVPFSSIRGLHDSKISLLFYIMAYSLDFMYFIEIKF